MIVGIFRHHKQSVDFHKGVLKTKDVLPETTWRKSRSTFQCFSTVLTSKSSCTFTHMSIVDDSACAIIFTHWIFGTWLITWTCRTKYFNIVNNDSNEQQTWWTCRILSWISLSTIITLTVDRHNGICCFYTLRIRTLDTGIRTFCERSVKFGSISTQLLTWKCDIT